MVDDPHRSLVSWHELLSLGVPVWTGRRAKKGRRADAC
jgi:hypothetical protein